MKNLFFLSILTILSASLFAQDTTMVNGTDSKQRIAVKEYSCPMHPEIVSEKPGKCSKCGMDLTLISKKTKNKMKHKHMSCMMM